MQIGIVKETAAGERRVAATPETVKKLVAKGVRVGVASGAGVAARYPDAEYVAAGAEIVAAPVAWAADMVFKIRPPTAEEIATLKSGSYLISLMELCADKTLAEQLAARGVNGLALERIPRTSRAQAMDVLSSQANIAGYRAVLEAAAQFGRFLPMMMTSAGSARPAKLAVLGAGVAGLQAIATARRLGAEVSAFDVRPEVKEQIQSLGAKFIDLNLGESGSGAGGYAKELSLDAAERQRQALADYLRKMDVVITTAQIPCKKAPVLVTEAAVQGMRAGSVIVDLAAGSGGNCPLTEADLVVVKHGVVLVGHTNYPSLVATDASAFFARNVLNFFMLMVEEAGGKITGFKSDLKADDITAAALVTFQGAVLI